MSSFLRQAPSVLSASEILRISSSTSFNRSLRQATGSHFSSAQSSWLRSGNQSFSSSTACSSPSSTISVAHQSLTVNTGAASAVTGTQGDATQRTGDASSSTRVNNKGHRILTESEKIEIMSLRRSDPDKYSQRKLAKMVGLCNFSGFKIYPGHGKRVVTRDAKALTFVSRKTAISYLSKKNPRKCLWTQVYRRLNKKGTMAEEGTKRKVRKIIKVERAIVGASLDLLRAKKSEKKEVRQAMREAAIRDVKEKKRAAKEKAKAARKADAKSKPKQPKNKAASKPASKGR